MVQTEAQTSRHLSIMLDYALDALAVVLILGLGFGLGFGLPDDAGLPKPYDRIAAVAGWIYFTSWSLSFYPQVYLNWKRQSVTGLSLDFVVVNVLGFVCYSIFNCALYFDKHVQAAYRAAHGGHSNAVRLNDVFFAVHAAAICVFTLGQCYMYDRGGQTVSSLCKRATLSSIVAIAIYGMLVAYNRHRFPMLYFLYFLSYIKMGVTLVKYMPQVYMNYKLKSTAGWNIGQSIMDFTGGLTSVFQLCLEAVVKHDSTAVTGDPVKFGLGFVSVIFDIILMTQHYILYHGNELKEPESPKLRYVMVHSNQPGKPVVEQQAEETPLLSPSAMSDASMQELSTATSGHLSEATQHTQTTGDAESHRTERMLTDVVE